MQNINMQGLANQSINNDENIKLMNQRSIVQRTKLTDICIKSIANTDNLNTIEILIMNRNMNPTLPIIKSLNGNGLSNLMNLKELDLSHQEIEKIECFNNLKRLKKLNLSYNRLSKIENIAGLKSLEILNLSNNLIQEIPIIISKNLNLIELLLSFNGITKKDNLINLKPLPNLKILELQGNPITNYSDYKVYTMNLLKNLIKLDKHSVDNLARKSPQKCFIQPNKTISDQKIDQLPSHESDVDKVYSSSSSKNPFTIRTGTDNTTQGPENQKQGSKDKSSEYDYDDSNEYLKGTLFSPSNKEGLNFFQNFTLNGDSICAISDPNFEKIKNLSNVSKDNNKGKSNNKIKYYIDELNNLLKTFKSENNIHEKAPLTQSQCDLHSGMDSPLPDISPRNGFTSPIKCEIADTPLSIKDGPSSTASKNIHMLRDKLELSPTKNMTMNEESLTARQSDSMLIAQLNCERAKIKGKLEEIAINFDEINANVVANFGKFCEAAEIIEILMPKFQENWENISSTFVKIEPNNINNNDKINSTTATTTAVYKHIINLCTAECRELLSKMKDYTQLMTNETENQVFYLSKLMRSKLSNCVKQLSKIVNLEFNLKPDIECTLKNCEDKHNQCDVISLQINNIEADIKTKSIEYKSKNSLIKKNKFIFINENDRMLKKKFKDLRIKFHELESEINKKYTTFFELQFLIKQLLKYDYLKHQLIHNDLKIVENIKLLQKKVFKNDKKNIITQENISKSIDKATIRDFDSMDLYNFKSPRSATPKKRKTRLNAKKLYLDEYEYIRNQKKILLFKKSKFDNMKSKKDILKTMIKNTCQNVEGSKTKNKSNKTEESYSPSTIGALLAYVSSQNSNVNNFVKSSPEKAHYQEVLNQGNGKNSNSANRTNSKVENPSYLEEITLPTIKNGNSTPISRQTEERVTSEKSEIRPEVSPALASVSLFSEIPNSNISAFSSKLTADISPYVKLEQTEQSLNFMKAMGEGKDRCSSCENKDKIIKFLDETLQNNKQANSSLLNENSQLKEKLDGMKIAYEEQIKRIVQNYHLQIDVLEEEKNNYIKLNEMINDFQEKIMEVLNESQRKINQSLEMMYNDIRFSTKNINPLKWVVNSQASTIEYLLQEKKFGDILINQKLLEIKNIINNKHKNFMNLCQEQIEESLIKTINNINLEKTFQNITTPPGKSKSLQKKDSDDLQYTQTIETPNLNLKTSKQYKFYDVDFNGISNRLELDDINLNQRDITKQEFTFKKEVQNSKNPPDSSHLLKHNNNYDLLNHENTRNVPFNYSSNNQFHTHQNYSTTEANDREKNIVHSHLASFDTGSIAFYDSLFCNPEKDIISSPNNKGMNNATQYDKSNYLYTLNPNLSPTSINASKMMHENDEDLTYNEFKTPNSDNDTNCESKYRSPEINKNHNNHHTDSQNNHHITSHNNNHTNHLATVSNFTIAQANNTSNDDQSLLSHFQSHKLFTKKFLGPMQSPQQQQQQQNQHKLNSNSLSNLCESIAQQIVQQKPKTKAEVSLMKMHKNFINYKKTFNNNKSFEKSQSNFSTFNRLDDNIMPNSCLLTEENSVDNRMSTNLKSKPKLFLLNTSMPSNKINLNSPTSSIMNPDRTKSKQANLNIKDGINRLPFSIDTSKISRKAVEYKKDMERGISIQLKNSLNEKRKLVASPTIAKYSDKFDINSPHHPTFPTNIIDNQNNTNGVQSPHANNQLTSSSNYFSKQLLPKKSVCSNDPSFLK